MRLRTGGNGSAEAVDAVATAAPGEQMSHAKTKRLRRKAAAELKRDQEVLMGAGPAPSLCAVDNGAWSTAAPDRPPERMEEDPSTEHHASGQNFAQSDVSMNDGGAAKSAWSAASYPVTADTSKAGVFKGNWWRVAPSAAPRPAVDLGDVFTVSEQVEQYRRWARILCARVAAPAHENGDALAAGRGTNGGVDGVSVAVAASSAAVHARLREVGDVLSERNALITGIRLPWS